MKLASKNNNTSSKKKNRKRSAPAPIIDNVIATRTRRKTKKIASTWDLETPIIIEIVSWLDQDSLMNLSLVSKQLKNIICGKEPGNKNKIIPVFEVAGTSPEILYQNLRHHFKNKKTKKKLQDYTIMRFKDYNKCNGDAGRSTDYSDYELVQIINNILTRIMNNICLNGITLLDFSSLSPDTKRNRDRLVLPNTLSRILPKLREVNFSNTCIDGWILSNFSRFCPLLEKVTSNDAKYIAVDGEDMFGEFGARHSNVLKEMYIDNTVFLPISYYREKFDDLNDHPEIFIFHKCCKAIERVSIRNARENEYTDSTISQNKLIKFVRNAPPTLRWFRSDLTLDNMTMLRLERPGIELLN
ncbi:hypothetical protein FRACYDRAFT_241027 [Fragilariopsis cylindrus CCMP1102]|uniref:F-box domain-containing protein n=1 Tax=Fragilariopsis cylindrus CCMP1102 TaxID=635003 RepID=A0A1E7F8I2_9STRA|nr:hypothetical protein FRACYDRAFT_241027 [Fragilariopsis cylindrus CCMP1102]|eukprot:OEU14482.1 hypothetical protein FRACYDRAFT_241027 [Fragilariopsis cylindrus CCMP1102]